MTGFEAGREPKNESVPAKEIIPATLEQGVLLSKNQVHGQDARKFYKFGNTYLNLVADGVSQ
jgi:hypothetical protein